MPAPYRALHSLVFARSRFVAWQRLTNGINTHTGLECTFLIHDSPMPTLAAPPHNGCNACTYPLKLYLKRSIFM